MCVFAATIQCPKETGGKQEFPTGFQAWESLKLLRESKSNGTRLGSSQQHFREAILP